jgi:hypothetical protein
VRADHRVAPDEDDPLAERPKESAP